MVELSSDEPAQPDVGRVATLAVEDDPVTTAADPALVAEYFTDPLCCWSWAFERELQKLRQEFGEHFAWRTRMGGMIAGWDRYHDPVNCVSRPLQMGPLWFQVRHTLGVELDDRIWFEDPPQSSYPACIAVKAAELQSQAAGEAYLQRLREAVMSQRRNIAKRAVLLEVAGELAGDVPELFDADRFAGGLDTKAALGSFRDDLQLARYLEIGRFPTLMLRRSGCRSGIAISGYRPYAVLQQAMQQFGVAVSDRPCEPASA